MKIEIEAKSGNVVVVHSESKVKYFMVDQDGQLSEYSKNDIQGRIDALVDCDPDADFDMFINDPLKFYSKLDS